MRADAAFPVLRHSIMEGGRYASSPQQKLYRHALLEADDSPRKAPATSFHRPLRSCDLLVRLPRLQSLMPAGRNRSDDASKWQQSDGKRNGAQNKRRLCQQEAVAPSNPPQTLPIGSQ
jgi:hypothetical protein